MQRHAVRAELAAGPRLADIAADDMTIENCQPEPAEMRRHFELELQFDARAMGDGYRHHRLDYP